MTYDDELTEVADQSSADALAILAVYLAATETSPSTSETAAAIAFSVALHNATAVKLADLHLADLLTVSAGRSVLPLGLAPSEGDIPRLTAAVETILAEDSALAREPEPAIAAAPEVAPGNVAPQHERNSLQRVDRLARSEPLEAASHAEGQAVALSDLVVAWTRVLSPGACTKCVAWAEGGREFPKKAAFKRHHGCTCTRGPITKEDRLAERN
ncbi:hypothetical protein HUN08_13245 [Gordonia sp. X0973]|uniref:hypothetical protein n=1 Tax=Gordonia sp. X0973 TaxID=2742602 RepID=UPI000F52E51A|nr:hypothetical protein [Gordonia sp. X0973]QKT08041.1 hypothetical protein HUN08_13245 [Gordonia sp. X0973]